MHLNLQSLIKDYNNVFFLIRESRKEIITPSSSSFIEMITEEEDCDNMRDEVIDSFYSFLEAIEYIENSDLERGYSYLDEAMVYLEDVPPAQELKIKLEKIIEEIEKEGEEK